MNANSHIVDTILDLLQQVSPSGAEQWTARCPAHTDHTPSLSIGIGKDGRVLLRCHAGCSTEDIVRAIGLTMADLSPKRMRPEQVARSGNPTGESRFRER